MLIITLSLLALNSRAIDCSKPAGTLPNPNAPAGHINADIPIEHIIVLMKENHSFDAYFGNLNAKEFYGKEVDGVSDQLTNVGVDGQPVSAYHLKDFCPRDPDHQWGPAHRAWDNGKNDHFVIENASGIGGEVMAYQDQTQLPYYYALANQFAIGDRYFSSAMGPTYPNRFFLLAGTAFGLIHNDDPPPEGFPQKLLFDVLSQYKITWKYYVSEPGGYLKLFSSMRKASAEHFARMKEFKKDLDAEKLPQVVFLESADDSLDEHPPMDLKIGQLWTEQRLSDLFHSSSWKSSAVFFTLDENGGYYDHVPPPEACAPDDIPAKDEVFKTYDHYGFRVPFIAISPFAKRHFVSHKTYDHTSILSFIELKYNLPSLTKRDANADAMLDFFDFTKPVLEVTEMPTSTKIEIKGCDNLQTFGQNTYNIWLHYLTELWLDVREFFGLSAK